MRILAQDRAFCRRRRVDSALQAGMYTSAK